MAAPELSYDSAMYLGREKARSKREEAANLINAARQLAREALEEENLERDLDAEYGPKPIHKD